MVRTSTDAQVLVFGIQSNLQFVSGESKEQKIALILRDSNFFSKTNNMEPLDDMMCLAPNDVAYASYRAVEVGRVKCQFNACDWSVDTITLFLLDEPDILLMSGRGHPQWSTAWNNFRIHV